MVTKKKICIDAGHGGHDSGAVGPNGLRESNVALAVAMLLGAALLPDFEVSYTRRSDIFVELGIRAMLANDSGVDAFFSVHCNSADSQSAEGFEVYTTPGQTAADQLATDVFLAWAAEFPLAVKRMDVSDGDPDKEANFAVIKRTNMRAILFELDFISSPKGETMLADPKWQARAARALAAGVRKHFFKTEDGKTEDGRQEEEPEVVKSKVEGHEVVKSRLLEISAELLTLHNSL